MSQRSQPQLPDQKIITFDYIVLPGDNPATLAERFGTHPAFVLEQNKLKDEKDLKPGVKLKIPVAVPTVKGIWARGREAHAVYGKPYTGTPKGTAGLLHASCTEEALQFCHAYYLDPKDKEYKAISFRGTGKPEKSGRLSGISILKIVGGDSGLGNPELPKHLGYLALGGKCDLFRGGKEEQKGAYGELLVGQAIRDRKTLEVGRLSSGSIQAHLFVHGAGPEGFISLFFGQVDLCVTA